ncbi:hypothetical protein D3C81_2103690 [compost metagenome]
MLEHLRRPAVVALGDRFLGLGQDCIGTAHEFDVLLARFGRWQWEQVGRVAVIPAQVALVDGLGVMVDRTVVATVVPLVAGALRQLDLLGDLGHGEPLVGQ